MRRGRTAGGPKRSPRELGEGARAALGLFAVVVAALAIAAPAALLLAADDTPDVEPARVAAAARDAGGESDPFAWSPDREAELELRAAAGTSPIIYELSPGGVVASAKRTARWRDEIERAARSGGVDPDLLEAMVFLESAGRPQVIAGDDVEAAAGLAQILASTGSGMLGMEIDLQRSRELTERMARAARQGDERKYRRLTRERAEVDERFDPEAALAGAVRYLRIAREEFGRDDLAVASYHMGIGNLQNVIRAYTGVSETPIRDLVADQDLSYARLYFDSSPLSHPQAWSELSGFADESLNYLWKVLGSKEIMRLYREEPDRLDRLVELHDAKATQEEVFHPEDETEVFEGPDDVLEAREDGRLVAIPDDPALGFRVDRQAGELAPKLGQRRELYRALRPEALATLIYLAGMVEAISAAERPLRVTSAVRDTSYQELLRARNPEATDGYSLHTTGWSFDILRDYQNRRQARAFQFALDRLRALAVIDYAYEPRAIHVTVSKGAAPLVE